MGNSKAHIIPNPFLLDIKKKKKAVEKFLLKSYTHYTWLEKYYNSWEQCLFNHGNMGH